MKPSIVVAVDLSECTGAVVRRASQLARRDDASLVLLHVVELPEGLDVGTEVSAPQGRQRMGARELLVRDAWEQLEPYLEELDAQGVDARGEVVVGPPASEIVQLARRSDTVRVVMGTHGRRGLSRLLYGSVAQRVQSGAGVPVEIVPSHWRPGCTSRSCAWCASGRTRAAEQLRAELDG